MSLAALRQVLVNAERLERLCQESYSSLYESDGRFWRISAMSGARCLSYVDARPQFRPYWTRYQVVEDLLISCGGTDGIGRRLPGCSRSSDSPARRETQVRPVLDDVVSRRDALRRVGVEHGVTGCAARRRYRGAGSIWRRCSLGRRPTRTADDSRADRASARGWHGTDSVRGSIRWDCGKYGRQRCGGP